MSPTGWTTNYTPRQVTEFRGAFAFLSNVYRFTFYYRGVLFPTSEHAFHWDKTDDPILKERIRNAGTPHEAKAIGRSVSLVPDWQTYRRYVSMESILAAKFDPGLQTAEWLRNTGQAVLVEGNRWHDNDWGYCFCAKCAGTGRNLLGWMLMRHRHYLINGGLR